MSAHFWPMNAAYAYIPHSPRGRLSRRDCSVHCHGPCEIHQVPCKETSHMHIKAMKLIVGNSKTVLVNLLSTSTYLKDNT